MPDTISTLYTQDLERDERKQQLLIYWSHHVMRKLLGKAIWPRRDFPHILYLLDKGIYTVLFEPIKVLLPKGLR